MTNDKSLITAYILDGEGGGKKITWVEVEQWTPEQGVLWVHLDYTKQKATSWLKKQSGLDKFTTHAMIVDETRPRSVITSNGLLIFLRGVNLNPGEDPEDMVSIRVWIDEHRIITTRRRILLSITDIRKSIDEGMGPKSSTDFLRILNTRLIDRMADVLDSVDEKVTSLEEDVITSESHLLRPQIADIRRQAIMIRRYLAPQREALSALYNNNDITLLSKTDNIHLREATDRIVRYIEDLDSARERSSIIQEELSSRLSEQMDKRMYVLSFVAMIFLPLSFITGLLGINVGGIPGANEKWAFLYVCLILIVIAVGMMMWFKHKKWV